MQLEQFPCELTHLLGICPRTGRDSFEIRFNERSPSLIGEQKLGGVVGEHDPAVQKLRVVLDQFFGRCARRGLVHEMRHGQNPGAGQGFVVLVRRRADVGEETQECLPDARIGVVDAGLAQAGIGKPNVRAMIERLGVDATGFEVADKLKIVRAGVMLVYFEPSSQKISSTGSANVSAILIATSSDGE